MQQSAPQQKVSEEPASAQKTKGWHTVVPQLA
jgi:hypothetical protein